MQQNGLVAILLVGSCLCRAGLTTEEVSGLGDVTCRVGGNDITLQSRYNPQAERAEVVLRISTNQSANGIQKQVTVDNVVSDKTSAALSPDGTVVWVMVRDRAPIGGALRWTIHPFVGQITGKAEYAHLSVKKKVGGVSGVVEQVFDLSDVLRLLSIQRVKSGKPLRFDSDKELTSIRLESKAGNSVVAQGLVGGKFLFTVEVFISEDGHIGYRNAGIDDVEQDGKAGK